MAIKVTETKYDSSEPSPSNGEAMVALRKKTFSTCFATDRMVRVDGNPSWYRLYEAYDKKTMKCIRQFVKIKGVRVDITYG